MKYNLDFARKEMMSTSLFSADSCEESDPATPPCAPSTDEDGCEQSKNEAGRLAPVEKSTNQVRRSPIPKSRISKNSRIMSSSLTSSDAPSNKAKQLKRAQANDDADCDTIKVGIESPEERPTDSLLEGVGEAEGNPSVIEDDDTEEMSNDQCYNSYTHKITRSLNGYSFCDLAQGETQFVQHGDFYTRCFNHNQYGSLVLSVPERLIADCWSDTAFAYEDVLRNSSISMASNIAQDGPTSTCIPNSEHSYYVGAIGPHGFALASEEAFHFYAIGKPRISLTIPHGGCIISLAVGHGIIASVTSDNILFIYSISGNIVATEVIDAPVQSISIQNRELLLVVAEGNTASHEPLSKATAGIDLLMKLEFNFKLRLRRYVIRTTRNKLYRYTIGTPMFAITRHPTVEISVVNARIRWCGLSAENYIFIGTSSGDIMGYLPLYSQSNATPKLGISNYFLTSTDWVYGWQRLASNVRGTVISITNFELTHYEKESLYPSVDRVKLRLSVIGMSDRYTAAQLYLKTGLDASKAVELDMAIVTEVISVINDMTTQKLVAELCDEAGEASLAVLLRHVDPKAAIYKLLKAKREEKCTSQSASQNIMQENCTISHTNSQTRNDLDQRHPPKYTETHMKSSSQIDTCQLPSLGSLLTKDWDPSKDH